MDELLEQFLIEVPELVQEASDNLLVLERDPRDQDSLNSAFRAIHTLKGSVALFDLLPLRVALDAGEDILGAARSRQGELDSAAIDAMVTLVTRVDAWAAIFGATGSLPPPAAQECRQLTARLKACLDDKTPRAAPVSAERPAWVDVLMAAASHTPDGEPLIALRYAPHPDCFFHGDDPIALIRKIPRLLAVELTVADTPAGGIFDPFRCVLIIDALTEAAPDEVKPLLRFVTDQVTLVEIPATANAAQANPQMPVSDRDKPAAGQSLRIDPARVDGLLAIVGELVVAKNTLAHIAAEANRGMGGDELRRLLLANKSAFDQLVGQLHHAVMNVRLVPLRRSFERLPRLVRETASRLSKDVSFVVHGETIEADKSVVDGLFEPLLHIVRNAVDHGLEDATARLEAGKPAQGKLSLRAVREGDVLTIEVADDGRGIDPRSVRRSIRKAGLLPATDLDALSDEAVIDLVFLPGLSTAGVVSDISGRGVGLDVVRSAIEKLGGRVSLSTTLGKGTIARMVLPLSAVLTKILTVKLGDELYGVPLEAIAETVWIPAADVLPVGAGEAFVLRNRTLPLVHLRRLLGWNSTAPAKADLKALILDHAGERIGVAVDGFGDRLEVMVRPMSGLLSAVPGVRGTTLLGDGRVLMLLDFAELIQ